MEERVFGSIDLAQAVIAITAAKGELVNGRVLKSDVAATRAKVNRWAKQGLLPALRKGAATSPTVFTDDAVRRAMLFNSLDMSAAHLFHVFHEQAGNLLGRFPTEWRMAINGEKKKSALVHIFDAETPADWSCMSVIADGALVQMPPQFFLGLPVTTINLTALFASIDVNALAETPVQPDA